jgi:bifunctional non-homologous end joining protein LigD
MRAVRGQQLQGIVAERAGSQYRSGERSNDWVKWRANRGQEFVIGGYVPNGDRLDSILVGYYEGRDLIYAAAVRAGISSEFRRVLLPHFDELRMPRCPFANLPDRGERRWGEGLTAAKMVCVAGCIPSLSSVPSFWNGPGQPIASSSIRRDSRR